MRKVTKSLQRVLAPDRKYNSVHVQKLINKSMLDGKKLAAEKMVYEALASAAKKTKQENPLEVFEAALANISPNYEVKSRRVGGANFQIPFPISGHRQEHFAFMWLVAAIERLLSYFSASPRTHLRINPQDIGEDAIGHFAFFHSRFQSTLWPIALQWLRHGELAVDMPGRVINYQP